MIKEMKIFRIRMEVLVFLLVCLSGCSLENICTEDQEWDEAIGVCRDVPYEPYNCGRDHLNCYDGEGSDGIKSVECVKATSRCKIDKCNDNYHLEHEGGNKQFDEMRCVKDSVEKCGLLNDKPVNCLDQDTHPGWAEARCENSTCIRMQCTAGYYEDDTVGCLPEQVTGCGQDNLDCMDWREKNIDESLRSVTRVGCSEDGECVVTGCLEKLNDTVYYFDGTQCVVDNCPDDPMKTEPGECGCGVYEDLNDDDSDGEINCRDECPNNHTKWENDGEGGCEYKDTDHDGVDDFADVCITRDDIKTLDDLKRKGLCDGACPDMETIREYSEEERAKLCKIYITKEDNVDEYHIYNARDFDFLREKMEERHMGLSCTGDFDRCESTYNIQTGKHENNRREECHNGILYRYDCDECIRTDTTPRRTECKLNGNNNAQMRKISLEKIILERDINIDDIVDTVFSIMNDKDLKNVCSGKWTPLPHLTGIELNGNHKTIRYVRIDHNNQETRCSLMNAIIGELTLSKVYDLIIDCDVDGYGRAIFSNQINTSSLTRIELKKGKIQSVLYGDEGIGTLAGKYYSDQSEKIVDGIMNEINGVNINDVIVEAPYANSVGGLLGNANKLLIKNNISINTVKVEGVDNVGGMIGNASGMKMDTNTIIDNQAKNVKGNAKVGGMFGTLGSDINSSVTIYNRTEFIKGNINVGGFAGSVDVKKILSNGLDTYNKYILYNFVHAVDGKQNVGGMFGEGSFAYAGNADASLTFSNVYNSVNNVIGDNYIGGFGGNVGSNTYLFESKLVYNKVHAVVSKDDYVSNYISNIEHGSRIRFLNVYNLSISGIKGNNFVSGLSKVKFTLDGLNIENFYNKIKLIDGKDTVNGFLDIGEFMSDKKRGIIKNLHSEVLMLNGEKNVSNVLGMSLWSEGQKKDDLFTIKNVSSFSNVSVNTGFFGKTNMPPVDSCEKKVNIINTVFVSDCIRCNNNQSFAVGNWLTKNYIDFEKSYWFKYGNNYPFSYNGTYDSHCDGGLIQFGESDVDTIVNKLSSESVKWTKSKFLLNGQEKEFPAVFTEEEFIKKYLPKPDETIVVEGEAWLESMRKSEEESVSEVEDGQDEVDEIDDGD